MKKIAVATLAVAAGLSGLALSQTAVQGAQDPHGGAQQGGGDRVMALERELADARERSRKHEADLAALKSELTLIKQHLEAQALAAAAMQTTLDASEVAGFTYGINPNSREILLAGWRAKLAAEQRPLIAPLAEPASARRGR